MFELRWDAVSFYVGLALLFINGILGIIWGALEFFNVPANTIWLLLVGGLGLLMVVVPVVWRLLVPLQPEIIDQ